MPSIVWRFGISGAQEARADLASLGPAGEAAAKEIDAAWGKTNGTTSESIAQFRALRDAAAQAGVAANAANGNVQNRVDQSVGVAAQAKPAQSSASVFAQQFAAYDKQAAALRAQIDPLSAAQLKMNAAIGAAGMLLKSGTITETEHAAAVALAEKAYKDAEKAITSTGHAVSGSSGAMREAIVLMREMGRGDFSRMAGSATIEAQRLGLLGAILSPVGISIGVFTLAVIAAAVAEDRWASSQQKIVATLQGTAAASGSSVAQINAIGDAMAKSGSLSADAGRTFALAFASAGVGASNLQEATGLVKEFAAATGQDAAKAAAALEKAFADPAKGAVELNAQLHFLTAAQVLQITTMAEQGDKAGALKLLMDELTGATDGAAAHQTALAASMKEVAGWFSNAADAIGKYIAKARDLPEADGAARLVQLHRQRNALVDQSDPGATFFGAAANGKDAEAAKQAQLARIDKQIAEQEKALYDGKARSDQAAASVASTQLRAAADGLDPQAAQIAEKRGQIEQLRAKLDDPAALKNAGLTRDQAEQRMAAGEREIKQMDERAQHLDKHAAALARDSAAMTANARAALAAAMAYASGGDAAGGAEESRQKAVTDATRRGVPVGPVIAQQQNLDAANAAKDSEKSAAMLRDETAALEKRNAAVLSGAMTYKQATQAMEDEAKLHPILIRLNEGDTATRAATTKALADQTRALVAKHAADQVDALAQAISDQQDKLAEQRQQAVLASMPKQDRANDSTAARLKAQTDLRQKFGYSDFSGAAQQKYIADAVDGTALDKSNASKTYVTDTNEAQRQSTLELQTQITLANQSALVQAMALGQLKAEQDLRQHNVSAASAEGQAILESTAHQIMLNQALSDARASYDELKHTGESFIDTIGAGLGNLQNGASAFADVWVRALTQVEQEFVKLAFTNPLENQIFGQQLPTLGSTGGILASLFGSPTVNLAMAAPFDQSGISAALPDLGFNAKGTSSWRGGRTVVGENGPEIVDMPAGAAIYNADRSRAMMASSPAAAMDSGSSSGGDVHMHNHTGTPMKATQSKAPNGDMMIKLERQFDDGLQGSARSGRLQHAFQSMPKLTKDRP